MIENTMAKCKFFQMLYMMILWLWSFVHTFLYIFWLSCLDFFLELSWTKLFIFVSNWLRSQLIVNLTRKTKMSQSYQLHESVASLIYSLLLIIKFACLSSFRIFLHELCIQSNLSENTQFQNAPEIFWCIASWICTLNNQ